MGVLSPSLIAAAEPYSHCTILFSGNCWQFAVELLKHQWHMVAVAGSANAHGSNVARWLLLPMEHREHSMNATAAVGACDPTSQALYS